ncbi:class I SAM-dependent methyltransferase [Chloroflexota bacterium]
MDDRKILKNTIKAFEYEDRIEDLAWIKKPRTFRGKVTRILKFHLFRSVPSKIDRLSYPLSMALDIRFGDGVYTQELVQTGANTIGLDAAIIPITYACKRCPSAAFVRASVTNLPFKRESFDLILGINIFHHLTDSYLDMTIKEISRISRRKAIFIL